MNKKTPRKNMFWLIVFSFIACGFVKDRFEWKKIKDELSISEVTTLAVDPRDTLFVFAGTARALYKISNTRQEHKELFRIPIDAKKINFIYMNPQGPETAYVATDGGLYESQDRGQNWQRTFSSSDTEEKRCLSVAIIEDILYLGTQKGLFYRDIKEESWQRIDNELAQEAIYFIDQDHSFLYLATANQLYRLNKRSKELQTIFSLGITSSGGNHDDVENTSVDNRTIRFLKVENHLNSRIMLTTTQGIYFSTDFGQQWVKLPQGNFPPSNMTSLVIVDQCGLIDESYKAEDIHCLVLVVGTKRGAFLFYNGKWMPVYKGMETNDIRYLVKDAGNTVYAATDRGIFYLPLDTMPPFVNEFPFIKQNSLTGVGKEKLNKEEIPPKHNDMAPGIPESQRMQFQNYTHLEDYFLYEPKINEVHQLAIEYAEVSPQKIEEWRKLVKRKALFPEISAGIDRADSEVFHWDTGQSPDKLLKGRDYLDWDISLSWDLSDIVWNSDQTTIDARSKLMVELRDDILNQVTRLYFERRRLQVELLSNEWLDPELYRDKEMRVAELTALIDALTGGVFSARIQKSNRERKGWPWETKCLR